MKVRVRFGSTTKVIPIDDEVANFVQLSELRRLIHEAFGDSLTGSFSLSLNKTDIFKDETQTLKDYEIVSGDLLHIISDSSFAEPNQKKTKPLDPQMNVSNTIKDSTSSKDPENTNISTVEIEPEAATSQSTCGFDTSYSPQYISGDKISLQMLLSETPPKNLHQSLIVALHYLMLDSGFYLCDGSEVPDVNTYAACCDVKNQLSKFADILKATEFYKLYYFHPFCKGAMCLMICVPMGSKLVINGKVVTPKVENSSLPKAILCPKEYVNEENNSESFTTSYQKLSKLTRIFKDTFVLCMLGELKHALGFPDYTGLLALHSEIMLNIMSHLDVKSLSKFSQVCRHLWILSQDNLLWRTLCQRDFKGCDTTDVANDWRKKYKGLYQSQKRTEVLRGPLNPLCFQMPHPFCFPPPAPQPSPFSTIGGDYDLQPAYFSTRSRLFRDPFM
ncbi:F-box only protein 7 isoform X1 [Octopus sinensis]|uniref:F-box only protein 7 isoform X1 n=1 Tax=Octopus sinensis TaxID=2607531 RepID=A0A6P7SAH7_9MOLL|nr:F-box only protein 7 isoform X1 [Octopus sinensis]